MKYSCRIEGELLACRLTPDRDLDGAVFCCSGMAPLEPVSGGDLVRSVGSFLAMALPSIPAGRPHEFRIRYAGGYTPANRAWMPLGPYLKVGEDILPLPPTPQGRVSPPRVPTRDPDTLPLVPQPTEWRPTSGRLDVDGFAASRPAFQAVSALAARQGMRFDGGLPIRFHQMDMPMDAYRLTIAWDGVTVQASSYGGEFYACVTLMTLLQHGALPCGEIVDIPRFAWRGQHLDTARHYYDPDTILTLLDLMALLKLNRFHWHFSDDEAFRIALDGLPDLAEATAFRGEGELLPALFAGAPRQGGIYTKKTVRDVIAHAAALNIEIMPEIETPAHSLAIAMVYPETRDPGDNGQEVSVQGYRGNVLNPAMPRTWDVWHVIIDEIAELFPFEYIHLGCDELPADTWMSSPRARALMADHALTTTQDLQGWTIEKLARYAVSKGKKIAAWEEAGQGCNGGIGNGALLFSWTGQDVGIDLAKAGYEVVMTPAQHVYLDMAHTGDPADWGASWAAFVDLPDTIDWNPVPDTEIAERIAGVQGAFWSEFTTADNQIWPMLMPRLLGVATMAWQTEPPGADVLAGLSGYYSMDAAGTVTIGTVTAE